MQICVVLGPQGSQDRGLSVGTGNTDVAPIFFRSVGLCVCDKVVSMRAARVVDR